MITPHLETLLRTRQFARQDQSYPPTAYVFGTVVGDRIKNIRTAWRLTCQRAGITGLHFHDLRREAGSRLLETPGVSVMEVRDYLGHANVTTTNTYLASSHVRLREALRKRDVARAAVGPSQGHDDSQHSALIADQTYSVDL